MLSSSDGSEQKNHCFSGSGASSSLTMKQAPSSVTGASGSRLNHVRSSQPIDSMSTLVPGSSMRAAAARLEPADAAASTRPSLLAVDRDGPATNELNDEQSESMGAMRAIRSTSSKRMGAIPGDARIKKSRFMCARSRRSSSLVFLKRLNARNCVPDHHQRRRRSVSVRTQEGKAALEAPVRFSASWTAVFAAALAGISLV